MAPQFHETRMGHEFYQGQIPQLIKALNRIGDNLEKLNETIEKMDQNQEERDKNRLMLGL